MTNGNGSIPPHMQDMGQLTTNPRTGKPAGMLADLTASIGVVASLLGIVMTTGTLVVFFAVLRSDVSANTATIEAVVASSEADRLSNAELRGTMQTFIRLMQQHAELPTLYPSAGDMEYPGHDNSGRIASPAN